MPREGVIAEGLELESALAAEEAWRLREAVASMDRSHDMDVDSPRLLATELGDEGYTVDPNKVASIMLVKIWYRRGAPTQQYSSPPKGQRTKGPLRWTSPSSTTANSTTTATTKRKLEKTATTYYFGVLHYLMSVPSITKTLLYIGMGVDGDFPPSP
jgi:hypothetical protein